MSAVHECFVAEQRDGTIGIDAQDLLQVPFDLRDANVDRYDRSGILTIADSGSGDDEECAILKGDGLNLDIAEPAHAGRQVLPGRRKRAGQEAGGNLRERTARLAKLEEYEQTDDRDHSGDEAAHSNDFPASSAARPYALMRSTVPGVCGRPSGDSASGMIGARATWVFAADDAKHANDGGNRRIGLDGQRNGSVAAARRFSRVRSRRESGSGRRAEGTGLIAAATPAQGALGARALLISVVDAAQTHAVLFGASGALESLGSGAVVIATSTVPPPFIETLEAQLRERGIFLIDAPVSGGAAKAATGELSVMASGDPQAFDIAARVLDAITSKVYRLGDRAGIGSRVKSVNQLLAGVHIAAACEAITYAIRLGVDPAVAYDVITHSAGNSWMFENRVPHVLENDYTPRSAINIFVKDLGIVLDVGRAEKFPLPLTAAAHQLYLAAAAMGMGGDDDASIARVFAALADLKLPQ